MSTPEADEHVLAEKARQLPEEPGVYLFKDARGKVLYVGKAKSLRDRLRSYFGAGAEAQAKTRALMRRAYDLDYVGARNEIEALILECNLIKEYKPRYNIRLRDDKKYPYIRITRDRFPRVFVTRTIVHDGSQYFGPYSDVGGMRRTLALLQRVFQTRPCTPESLDGIDRPCLYYDIKMCQAPCVGLQSHESYMETVDHVKLFLEGHTKQLVGLLQKKMSERSGALEFEQAARLRDQIQAIERMTDRMRTLVTDDVDRDAIAMRRDGPNACGLVMKIRGGKLLASETFYLSDREEDDNEVYAAFFQQYYNSTTSVPHEILTSHPLPDTELLSRWLGEKSQHKIVLSQPQRGDKLTLVKLALRNATLKLDEWALAHGKAEKRVPENVIQLRDALGETKLPRRIECFDISNFQGAFPVASLVHFEAGEPNKSRYRHFKIKGIQAPNDFAMMEHVVERHFRSLLQDDHQLPEIVLVDGGKGQLGAARKALDRLQIADRVTLIGLAKRQEEIFRYGQEHPLRLPRTSASLKLLQRIRNEAHRFAIGYHRKLRQQDLTRSALDDIPGVGIKTRLRLLRHFGSVEAIRQSRADQLAQVPGIGVATAERILAVLSHPALVSGSTHAQVQQPETSPASGEDRQEPDDASDPGPVQASTQGADPDDLMAREIDVDPLLDPERRGSV